MSRNKISLKRMISAALAAGLALTMTVTAFADEPYTAYNYDYWDDAIPSQSAYRVEKTVTCLLYTSPSPRDTR